MKKLLQSEACWQPSERPSDSCSLPTVLSLDLDVLLLLEFEVVGQTWNLLCRVTICRHVIVKVVVLFYNREGMKRIHGAKNHCQGGAAAAKRWIVVDILRIVRGVTAPWNIAEVLRLSSSWRLIRTLPGLAAFARKKTELKYIKIVRKKTGWTK